MTLLAPPRDRDSRGSAQHRRSPWILLLLLLALAITLVGIFPFRQIIAQHRQVDMTQAKLSALHAENAALEDEIALLHTSTELERLAREQFGVVRRGETAYMATMPDDDGHRARPAAVAAVESAEADPGFLARLWDFLTGRDLVPDG